MHKVFTLHDPHWLYSQIEGWQSPKHVGWHIWWAFELWTNGWVNDCKDGIDYRATQGCIGKQWVGVGSIEENICVKERETSVFFLSSWDWSG